MILSRREYLVNMKKQLLLIAAASLLILSSCGGTTSSSSASNSSESSSSSNTSSGGSSSSSTLPPGPSIDVEAERTKIMNLLNEAKTSTNYTYGFLSEDGTVTGGRILTPTYIADASGATASVALPSYEKEGETLLYSVEKQNGSYVVLNALSYEEDGVTHPYYSTSELSYLSLLDREDVAFTGEDLIHQSGYFVIEDQNVIQVFASMFNLGNYVSNILRVFINPIENEEIHVGFAPNYTDSDGSISEMISATTGVIRNVGTSSLKEVEDFVASFALPETALTSENLSYLNADVVTYEVSLTRYLNGQAEVTYVNKENTFDYQNNRARVITHAYGVDETTYLKKGSEGEALEQFISSANTLAEVPTGSMYDDVAPSVSSLIELSAFRKVDEDTYRYFGYKANELVEKFSQYYDGMGVIIDLEANTNAEGEVTNIHATSWSTIIGDNTFHYEFDVTFKEPVAIEEVTVHEEEADVRISNALAKFDSANGYQIVTHNVSNSVLTTTYTVKDNILFVDNVHMNTAAGGTYDYIHSYSGYVFQEGGVAPFTVGEDMIARTTDSASGEYESIDDYVGIQNIAPQAFVFTGDTSLKANTFVRGLDEVFPLGPNGDFILEPTLTFTFDSETSTITSYQYENEITSEDVATISYGVALPESIDFSGIEDAFVAPTTWEEAHPSIHAQLAEESFIGEYASEVPYLYNATLDDYWFVGNAGYIEFIISNNYSLIGSDVFEKYAEDYKAYLLESGYEVVVRGSYTYYVKEGLPFAVRLTFNSDSMLDIRILDRSQFGI